MHMFLFSQKSPFNIIASHILVGAKPKEHSEPIALAGFFFPAIEKLYDTESTENDSKST